MAEPLADSPRTEEMDGEDRSVRLLPVGGPFEELEHMLLSQNRRRQAVASLLCLVTMAGVALLGPTSATLAEDASKPAKKDSRPAAQPKEATFEVEISPKTAKPGDVVTLTVTAKLSPEWHIYSFSKTQPEQGPRHTQFDLFDKGGLVAEGDWTPSAEPTREKEEAFPDLPFVEFHEFNVSWSQKLKVPADAKPGKRTLKVQAAYQLCSKQSCSFPGQWTLPAADVVIESAPPTKPPLAQGDKSAPADGAVKAVSFQGTAAQPKRKDSRANLRGKEASLTASITPKEAKPGDIVNYTVTAKVAPGWHIYKYSKEEIGNGPAYTSFDFFNTGGLTLEGEWSPAAPPIKKKEPVFNDIEFLEFYENEASWTQKLRVPPDAKPGTTNLAAQVAYQICDAKSCQRQTFWSMEPITLTILPGLASEPSPTTKVATSTPPATQPPATASISPGPPESDQPKPPQNEGEQKASLGLLSFLLWSAGGGLAALVMPCVWPMIPITVNFFVKQGQKSGGRTTPLALAYSLAIIGIFTGMGVLFSVFFGASSISKLANNAWLNFGVAALFIVFGMSLLGLFELRLPNFLLNASAQGESKGGLIGVMFMALTLTITSFTCTFPVVGALVVMAAGGDYFYPTLGLLTFSSVVALPFFVLAMAPNLLSKVPKSGDWMNAVKVIGGLVEIGAAFKFVNTAECALGTPPSDAWFNAPTILAIWVVLATVCGIYLLGMFKTDHDHDDVKVGPGRLVAGSAFLFLALYLAPALFGNPPHGPIYGRLIVGILPADAGELDLVGRVVANVGSTGGASSVATTQRETKATSSDPELAQRQQTYFHGVLWGMSYEAALERAKLERKPVLIDFTGVNCANCRLMERYTLPRPEVVQVLQRFVTVQLYTDLVQINTLSTDQKIELAEKNFDLEEKLTRAKTNPYYVILTPEGRVLGSKGGYVEAPEFIGFLNDGLTKFASEATVANGQ